MNQVQVIPLQPDAITADWLTDGLRANGILGTSRVTSLCSASLASQGIFGQAFLSHRVPIRSNRANPRA